ncbi:hypothetical protein [Celeribacter sp.]|uniref:hypothetical protein n=1 Tax=Celeribacter sp. TaxID=1890673 RepID=UPI003A903369
MTIRIVSDSENQETHNAKRLRDSLLASAPDLDHPDISAEIHSNLCLPGRELDLVLIYHDTRPKELQLKTSDNTPIHSFVLIVEVKQHSPDLIRFVGPKVEVRYDQKWHDATSQCNEQTFALKRYQEHPYQGQRRRSSTFVQRAIWLARADEQNFNGIPAESSIPVHFADLTWQRLVDCFEVNAKYKSIRTLVDHEASESKRYHSLETLHGLLTHKVTPTRLDLRRINSLTQTRFDAEKTTYIQNLGNGLLLLRGRGGTGKTFALVQVALHLARQGKSAIILTYNHGLIADINRSLRFISEQNPNLNPIPRLETRYTFLQSVFTRAFGSVSEAIVRKHVSDISERENIRLWAISKPQDFLASTIPGECTPSERYPCPICKAKRNGINNHLDAHTVKIWSDVAEYSSKPSSVYDFVLIDEGQDWSEEQRDLFFHLFEPGKVVVADGVDQFVGLDRCNWDRGDIPINRRHRLRSSRRTKAATCQTIAEVARELAVPDWDLEPDPNTHGGRFTVIVEPDAPRAVERGLEIIDADQREQRTLRAVDNLVCLPSSRMTGGKNFAALFDKAIEKSNRDSWRGFDESDRRVYPVRDSQLRAIQYHSCRGMEGWTTLCLGLDLFYDYQTDQPRIDISRIEEHVRKREGFLFSKELLEKALAQEANNFALNWIMIPLTRSIDHLVVHISDEGSPLGRVLRAVSDKHPGSIEWLSAG